MVARSRAARPKPGMPIGTPGMEVGDRKQAYDVISFDAEGNMKLFARH